MPRWLFALALATAAACSASNEPEASDAGKHDSGGDAGGAGFNPFGDASFGGGGCDGGVDAAAAGDAAPDALDPECQGVAGAGTWADVAPIFVGCTGEVCHTAPTWNVLVGKLSAECCAGRLLVSPGHPSASYLVDKLTGQNLCGGVQMPSGKPPLADDDVGIIVRWICSGAPAK